MSEQSVVSWTNLPRFNEANINALRGCEVFTTPQLNEYLIVRTNGDTIFNLGRVTYARLHDETGRNFVVGTDKMPQGSTLFVKLAKEIPNQQP